MIATAGNVRQMNALIDTLDREMKQAGVEMGSQEGDPESGWILLDFEDVIVHLFSREQREFYDLESLWIEAPRVPLDVPADARISEPESYYAL